MDINSSSLGYIFDFIASIYIVFSIIFRSKRRIKVDSETLYDGNPFLYESQLRASWDGWIGIIIFFLATILHLFHFELERKVFWFVLVLTATLLLTFRKVITYFVEQETRKEYPHYDEVKKRVEAKNA